MIQGDQRLSDTLSDLVKVNHGKFSKFHLCPSKIDSVHVDILFYKDKSNQNGPKVNIVLWDTLSDLNKLNYGKYSKKQLCSSKINITHGHILFFKDKIDLKWSWHDTGLSR